MTTAANVPMEPHQLRPPIEQICQPGPSCQAAAVIADLWVWLAVGAGVLGLLVAITLLRSARQTVEQEQSRTAAERDAFEAFAECVAQLSVETTSNPTPAAGGLHQRQPQQHRSSEAMTDVQDAYRETVMAMDHYDEEYAESLAENMTVELGADISEAVSEGCECSPMLQALLISRAQSAAAERTDLLQTLDREAASLQAAADDFDEIEATIKRHRTDQLDDESLGALADRWASLKETEERCQSILEDRQQHIQRELQGRHSRDTAPTLFEFLYDRLAVDFPVLATGTNLLKDSRTLRQSIVHLALRRA